MASSLPCRVRFINLFFAVLIKVNKIIKTKSGILVPGGFGTRGTEGMILAANWARANNKPYLGICLGFQCAVIEYCRNQLHLQDANSAEFNKETQHQVVCIFTKLSIEIK